MSFIIFRRPSKRSWPFLASSALLLFVFTLFFVFRISGGYWIAALILYLLTILLSYHLWTKKYPQYSQGEYLYMNQAFLKYKRMGVKTDVDYRAYLLGGVYAAVGHIGFNVMVGVWLFREITRAPMMDD